MGEGLACPRCGQSVAEGARFCGRCGAEIPAARLCPSCGATLRPDVRFCGSCGAPSGTGPAAPMAGRARANRAGPRVPAALLAFGGVGAVAAAVFAAWFLFLRGDGDTDTGDGARETTTESAITVTEPTDDEATDPATGLPMRPGVRLDHPSGASAMIPAGPALYGEAMDLRRIALEEDPWWDHGGSGWEFVSWAGVPVTGQATVDIPAADGNVLIVWTAAGHWVEIDASPITLANGESGLRASVRGIPAPWTFAAAMPRADAPPLALDDQADLNIEQLYWNDPEAWKAEMLAWLATDPANAPVGLEDLAVAAPAALGLAGTSQAPDEQVLERYQRLYRQLIHTRRLLGGARLGMAIDPAITATGIPVGAGTVTAQGLYAAGVQRLAKVRDFWLELRPQMAAVQARYDYSAIMDRAIESTLRDYTPWGLEFVLELLGDSSLTGPELTVTGVLGGLDLRVLEPYGELAWDDIVLQPGMVPESEAHIAASLKQGGPAFASAPETELVLRFYSNRAMERLAVIDTLKGSVGTVVRWLPVALAAMGLVPGSVGLSAAFATIDQIVDYVQDRYDTEYAGGPYAYMEFEAVSAGGIGGTSFIMDMIEERAEMALFERPMLPSHGLTIAQFAYSVGVYMAVRNTDWYLWKSIREVNEGTRGYCPQTGCSSVAGAVPPVMIHARSVAPLLQAEGAYPASHVRLMSYRLDHRGDFHESWLSDFGSDSPSGPLETLPFVPYRESAWPGVTIRTEPQYQAITLQIPEAAIPAEARQGRPPGTPLAEFEPVLYLEGPAGELVTIPITGETRLEGGAAPNTYYTTVLLRGPKQAALTADDLALFPALFRPAADQQAVFELPGTTNSGLRTTLKASILFKAASDKRLTFDVNFSVIPPRKVVGREIRVNYALATTSSGRVAYKGTTSQGLPIEIAIDEDANRWEIVRWDVKSTRRPTRSGTGICGNDEVSDSGLPALTARWERGEMSADEYELGKWLFSGPMQGDSLARGPVPAFVDLSKLTLEEERTLAPFGTRSLNRTQIAGDVIVPFSDFFGCTALYVTYTATRQ